MEKDNIYSGYVLQGEELNLTPAQLIVKGGVISAIEEISKVPNIWILPAFFNAHTHLGDTIALDVPYKGSIVDIVTPPHGLKHRILGSVSDTDLVRGMQASLTFMTRSGTAACADFREGGVKGVSLLKDATYGSKCEVVIFGRDGGEEIADGLGISSIRDVVGIEQQIKNARKKGKKIAIHAGERDAHDIDGALSYDPDLLIHCTHATEKQLKQCSERRIPIVLCVRSNWILDVTNTYDRPPIKRMIGVGNKIFIGTDNVMLVQPDMFREMEFIFDVYRIAPRIILHAAIAGSNHFGRSHFIEKGAQARFFCIDAERANLKFTHDIYTSIVKRVNTCDIVENILSNVRE